MKIEGKTPIGPLLEQYPFLIDTLAELSPSFARLRNPMLRRTLGRVATLETAARQGKVDLQVLLATLNQVVAGRGAARELPATTDRAGRLEALKQIIRELHAGGDFSELTRRFAEVVGDVSPREIAEMEQQLVMEGLPVAEIKRLCDVHAELFRRSLEAQPAMSVPPGHPVHTLRAENAALAAVAADLRARLEDPALREHLAELRQGVEKLAEVERHYRRKEYQLFPVLERHGVDAPPQVMWAVHDEIRDSFKRVRAALEAGDLKAAAPVLRDLLGRVEDMFFKEEKILFPMCLTLFAPADWAAVRSGEGEFGYALVTPAGEPAVAIAPAAGPSTIPLGAGALTAGQLGLLFSHLPVDLTFVDEQDVVCFYSEGDRIFPRSPGVIGRKVQKCHPPDSVHVVQKILEAFRDGTRDQAEFWIERGGKFVHIRYRALRDGAGDYRGVLEVVQDATAVRGLTGERRLLQW
ncbi:MAG TPA: DUF438 domain-containing protein [Clostridiales bacterium]|nr:DUF438 domain-containing protein [Clostridiales bacterium]